VQQQDRDCYQAEKEEIADKRVYLLDKRFPGLATHHGDFWPAYEQNDEVLSL